MTRYSELTAVKEAAIEVMCGGNAEVRELIYTALSEVTAKIHPSHQTSWKQQREFRRILKALPCGKELLQLEEVLIHS